MEQQIFTTDAAKLLNLGVSTLRKYAALVEAKGYEFERGTNNGRIFRENDLTLIAKMIEAMAKEGVTIEQAAETAVQSTPQVKKQKIEPNIELHAFIEQMKELEAQQASLTAMNKELVKQVENLTEKIEERERDQQLFKIIEDSRKKKKRRGIAIFHPLNALTGKR